MSLSRRHGLVLAAASLGAWPASAFGPPVDIRRETYLTRGQRRTVVVVSQADRVGPMSGVTVLLLHGSGGLNSNLDLFQRQGRRLASLGYRVIMPDYLSDAPDAAQTDDVRWWPQAVNDAIDWAMALPGAGRLVAMGYSRGGYLAAEVAVQGAPIEAVVGVASAGNVAPADIRRTPPVLLVHAERDPVIPPARTRRWAGILQSRGVAVETVSLDIARHGLTDAEWTGVFDRADDFFRRSLGRR